MQKTQVIILDDIDNTPGAESISFAINGDAYEIDLNKKNRTQFEKTFQEWVGHARKVRAGKARSRLAPRIPRTPAGVPAGDVRAWAKENGVEVNDRGRIPAEVMVKFQEASK